MLLLLIRDFMLILKRCPKKDESYKILLKIKKIVVHQFCRLSIADNYWIYYAF